MKLILSLKYTDTTDTDRSASYLDLLGSVASLLAATLYQGNPDRNHELWYIGSTARCILHMQALLE
jgi:hypothetical protein